MSLAMILNNTKVDILSSAEFNCKIYDFDIYQLKSINALPFYISFICQGLNYCLTF